MKKKMISLLLVLALVVGICPAAFAGEKDEKIDESAVVRDSFLVDDGLGDSELQEVWDEYNALSDEEAEDYIVPFEIVDKYYALTKAEQEALDAIIDSANERSAENLAVERANRIKIGPYMDITTIPAEYITTILSTFEQKMGTLISANVTYGGVPCYVFTQDSYDIYVAASAFYTEKNRVFPSAASVSGSLTTYINGLNTSKVYSTHMVSNWFETGVYYCSISQIASEASRTSDTSVFAKTTYEKSIYLEVGYDYLTAYAAGRSSVQPELKLEITNGSTYFGGLDVAGLGTSTNTTDISSLIKLGYHIGLAFSGSFTFGTAANILNTTISLAKTKKGTDYQYMASTEQLSNPSKSQYTRNCSMLAPFKLTRSANYYQMKIGLISANPTVKYKVTVGYTFS